MQYFSPPQAVFPSPAADDPVLQAAQALKPPGLAVASAQIAQELSAA
jgi:hypothetical protein